MTPESTTAPAAPAASPAPAAPAPLGPPPPYDDELAAWLATAPPTGTMPTLDELPAVHAATAALGRLSASDEHLARDGAFAVGHRTVPGPDGAPDVTLLVCRPTSVPDDVATPVVFHVHGGGMVFGDRATGMDLALDWGQALGLTIVSVEYRLAPEHPYPAPVEDCYAGLVWTAQHAAELGVDPDRLVVAGGSAGGGLAAATVLLARDRGGPAVAAQLLLCPMLDDRNDSASARQLDGLGMWDRTANELGWRAYLGPLHGTGDVPPYAAPARATDLSGLPPTFLDVGSAETFRDETVAFAQRIWQAGGRCELHVWPGGFHGFAGTVRSARVSQDALAAPVSWLRRVLAPSAPPAR
ncbi:alpha/beta hydrolase [Xylanimonas oleitrophica]|uniref:Alpha/beta hydrolase n=1 Tax=Xylanimonas oleitrophica TaxID=2607479 RepID=A0A2W5WQ78_9MICO|nr:alpha/beta hydrolase [Xylanimonas oleitrophica]PZR53102.1 alpha/beta hydrolase [Xylanimonas oleitrophica]